ncbi:MAG: PaaI family thioesterase [Demequina sp.]
MTGGDAVAPTAFSADTLMTRMGIEVTEVSAERAVGTIPVAGNRQTHGLLHGGASAALAETLGSLAAAAHGGDGNIAMGVDLNITHHRAVQHGTVTGIATALHRGRTTATYAVSLVDDDDNTVATARLTCAIRPRRGT